MIFLYSFMGVELPKTGSKDDLSTGQINAPTIPTASGSLDLLGSKRGRPQEISITTDGAICSETRLRTFRKMLGRRGQLRRYYPSRDAYEDVPARLVQIKPDRLGVQTNARVSLTFKVPWPIWENIDDGWFFDSGEFFDSGLNFDGTIVSATYSAVINDFSIDNSDSEWPGGGVITIISAGITDIPSVVGRNPFSFIGWMGRMFDGDVLVIDLDAKSITLNGIDAYDNALTNNPGLWLEIPDGLSSDFYVSIFTSGSIDFTWQWNRRYL